MNITQVFLTQKSVKCRPNYFVRKILLGYGFFIFSSLMFGQSNCIKEINYQLLEQRFHAIEQHVDVQSLPTLDLLKGKGQVQLYTINICIDATGYLTKTTNITYQENTFYPNPVT